MSKSNIEIDESQLAPAPTIFQRLKNVLITMILGGLLVQTYFFYGAIKSGSFTPASIVIYFDSMYFIGYLVICGIMGWFAGQDFLYWLKDKIDSWRFW